MRRNRDGAPKLATVCFWFRNYQGKISFPVLEAGSQLRCPVPIQQGGRGGNPAHPVKPLSLVGSLLHQRHRVDLGHPHAMGTGRGRAATVFFSASKPTYTTPQKARGGGGGGGGKWPNGVYQRISTNIPLSLSRPRAKIMQQVFESSRFVRSVLRCWSTRLARPRCKPPRPARPDKGCGGRGGEGRAC